MKRPAFIFFISFFLFAIAGNCSAQTVDRLVREVREAAADACVKVLYYFKADVEDVSISDKGFVEAQDNMWHLKGETYEVFTDGNATWVLDASSKEAVIEPAWTYDDLERFYESLQASGSVFDIVVDSKTESPKKPVSDFTPVLGAEWIITDLR